MIDNKESEYLTKANISQQKKKINLALSRITRRVSFSALNLFPYHEFICRKIRLGNMYNCVGSDHFKRKKPIIIH